MKKCALALVLFVMISAIQSVGAKAEAQAEPYSGAGIAIIAKIKDLRDYETVLSDGGVSALFLDINGEGDAVGSGGEKIASLSFHKTEINKNGKSAVLRLRDETSAEAVLNELNGDDDVTLFSENGQRLKAARAVLTAASGALDLRGETLSDVAEIRNLGNISMAKTVVLTRAQADADIVFQLKKLLIDVWLAADTEEDALYAVSVGCAGILTEEFAAAANALSRWNDLRRKPLIVAHRGNTGVEKSDGNYLPENGVQSAVQAVRECGADVIEIDVHLSKDGKVVVMHDEDISRTTDANGLIGEMNYTGGLDRIEIYDKGGYSSSALDPNAEKIPLLDDFFQALEYDDNAFYIEIKTSGDKGFALVDEVKRTIEKFKFEDRCNFISFFGDQIAYIRKVMPEYSAAMLSNRFYESPIEAMRLCNPYNAVYSPSKSELSKNVCKQLSDRGVLVSSWTYNSGDLYEDFYSVDAITTDDLTLLNGQMLALEAKTKKISKKARHAIKFKADAVDNSGGREEVLCDAVKIGGDAELISKGDAYYVSGGAEITVSLVYRVGEAAHSEMNGVLMSAPVTLKIVSGCAGSAQGEGILLSLVAALCAFAIIRSKR